MQGGVERPMATLSLVNMPEKTRSREDHTRTEQREHERLKLDIVVQFRAGTGQHCAAQLLNIGPEGIQVRCNVATAQVLHPMGGRIRLDNAPIVQTTIAVPHGDGDSTLSVCAQLKYVTTVAESPRCILGLQFIDPRPTAQRIISRLFDGVECELAHTRVFRKSA